MFSTDANAAIKKKPSNGTLITTIYHTANNTEYTRIYENGFSRKNEFIGYLTSSWVKCSKYSEQYTQKVSWTRSAGISYQIADKVAATLGLSKTVSKTSSVGSYIPADSTKYSKLGVSADYYNYYLKCIYTDLNFDESNTYYGDLICPTGDIYFDVYYK